jgi:hypothetical protein
MLSSLSLRARESEQGERCEEMGRNKLVEEPCKKKGEREGGQKRCVTPCMP